MGLALHAQPGHRLNTLTTVRVPDGVITPACAQAYRAAAKVCRQEAHLLDDG